MMIDLAYSILGGSPSDSSVEVLAIGLSLFSFVLIGRALIKLFHI